jgi:bifunctional oligoribonuclease and PAP phosphatase NrnA
MRKHSPAPGRSASGKTAVINSAGKNLAPGGVAGKIPKKALQQAATLIASRKKIWIATHQRPDGDALGCLLGLALALEKTGKQVARLCPDPVPENYHFLPSTDLVSRQPPDWEPDLLITVDCDGLSRTGRLTARLETISPVVDIDHHATEKSFGEVQVIVPSAAATGVIVYHLLLHMQIPLDHFIATCLYCAVLTDTGRFSFPNTNDAALATAHALVKAGAKPGGIARHIYENRTLGSRRLLGIALTGMKLDPGRHVSWAILRREDFRKAGGTDKDTEGIIDFLRSVKGVEVGILLTQAGGGSHISLRSRGKVDVGRLALQFGGGGHREAAGCDIAAPPEEAVKLLIKAVQEALANPTA